MSEVELDDSFAFVIAPLLKQSGKKGEIDVSAGVYIPNGYDDDTTEMMTNLVYILASVFHRINSDPKFAKKTAEYATEFYDAMAKENKKAVKKAKSEKGSIITLRPDTPTKGSA